LVLTTNNHPNKKPPEMVVFCFVARGRIEPPSAFGGYDSYALVRKRFDEFPAYARFKPFFSGHL